MDKVAGNRIRERRKALGYTQTELGQVLGVNKSTIARYEKGYVDRLSTDSISKMAKFLKCNPTWLSNLHPDAEEEYIETIMDAINSDDSFLFAIMDACKRYNNLGEHFTEVDWIEILNFIKFKAMQKG